MKASVHLSPAEIRSLLSGDAGNPDQEITFDQETLVRHVGECSQCQKSLETVAAEPDVWQKATRWFSDSDLASQSMAACSLNEVTSTPDASMMGVLDAASHPELLGSIPGYDIECEIGRGGMGVVFKAFDHQLHRTVAIKFLSPQLAQNGTARLRFAREARAVAGVFHPNVIAVHGVSSHRDIPYLVMPFVSGPSLQRLVDQRGPLEEKELIRVAMQITAGLSAAHLQGLVHRDIKPANILVEADVSRVSVTDFGLARAIDDASMTQSGMFLGTPNFMSPEQAHGSHVDARSDLFSLGSVMYFLATGHLPFRAESPVCVLHRITHDQPTPVADLNNEISATTCQIIQRLHSKDCGQRFASAAELHGVLQQQLAHLHHPMQSRPPVMMTGWTRAKRIRFGLAVTAGLAMLMVGAFAFNPGDGSADRATETGQPMPPQPQAVTPLDAERMAQQAEQAAGKSLDDATRQSREAEMRRQSDDSPSTVPEAPAAPLAPPNPPTMKATDSFWQSLMSWLFGA